MSQVILSFALEEPADAILALDKRSIVQREIGSLGEMADKNRDEALVCRRILDNLPTGKDDITRAFNYYYSRVPDLARSLRDTTFVLKKGEFTTLFQRMGDNIRLSGRASSDVVDAERLFDLPRRLFLMVELGKAYNRLNSTGVAQDYFVIDAIRHPFEIHYLREKISRFFVVAISTEESLRQERLMRKAGLANHEVEALDAKEYPRRGTGAKKGGGLRGYARFASQDMESCIAAADIHLSNTEPVEGSKPSLTKLTRRLCRYIALAQHPGLVTPTAVERCMQSAFTARLNSGCISRQVGAIVTNAEFSVLAVGWNDVPKGQVPCLLRYSNDLLHGKKDSGEFTPFEKKDESFRRALGKALPRALSCEERDGLHLAFCFKSVHNQAEGQRNQVHTRSLHAEENAFLQISRYGGQGVLGGMLFTTASPCELCAKKAYQLGIETIYYIDPYPGISAEQILGAGDRPPDLVLFSGVIGRAYHELYEPLMPFKDELAALLPDEVHPGIRDQKEQVDLFADRGGEGAGGTSKTP